MGSDGKHPCSQRILTGSNRCRMVLTSTWWSSLVASLSGGVYVYIYMHSYTYTPYTQKGTYRPMTTHGSQAFHPTDACPSPSAWQGTDACQPVDVVREGRRVLRSDRCLAIPLLVPLMLAQLSCSDRVPMGGVVRSQGRPPKESHDPKGEEISTGL